MQERRSEQEKTSKGGNIFNGFDTEILSEAFNVDVETIRKLQGQNEERGVIVRAEELRLTLPEESEQEERREQQQREGGRWPLNGLEETICTLKLRENIGHPSRSDVYNPRGGRVSTVNSLSLPILNFLQLSAERGTLYRVRIGKFTEQQ